MAWPDLHVPCTRARKLRHVHAGMQAFAAAAADNDEGLLGLCDMILEALQFCPGFQTCLTCGKLSIYRDLSFKWPSAPQPAAKSYIQCRVVMTVSLCLLAAS